ncbi:MAG: hypothetical protein MUC29_09095 [Pyrinomonadaceae bacterium]|jgi:opacity protein-like surface antigen|nr:hypothetical protein [Pyrinomonadaceae bacterium]
MLGKLFLIAILAFSFFADNCNKKPSESETAKRGFALAQPVIEALEKYNQDNKDYPQSLPQLTPKYLKENLKDGNGINFTYNYNQQKKSYELEFSFTEQGSVGLNECSYYSDTKAWSCSKKM